MGWYIGGDGGVWTAAVAVGADAGHATAIRRGAVVFMEGEGVEVGAGNGGWG